MRYTIWFGCGSGVALFQGHTLFATTLQGQHIGKTRQTTHPILEIYDLYTPANPHLIRSQDELYNVPGTVNLTHTQDSSS